MAGQGSRLKPHTITTPKPLIKIAGKTIVERLVEDIAKVVGEQVEEIGFIIGPASKNFPADAGDNLKKLAEKIGAKAQIFVQEEAKGTAHAVYQAKAMLQGNVVVAFADTLFKADFTLDHKADGVIWVMKVTQPELYGVVKLHDGIITDFIEKPQEYVSDLAIIGIYYFKEGEKLQTEIIDIVEQDKPGKGGEYQLTDALENLKAKGLQFVPGTVNDWMDTGNKDFALSTNAKVLEYESKEGKNLVHHSVILENSTIVPPCYVGQNVKLKNTTIGPYVSIGDNAVVENSTLTQSLIQNNVNLQNAVLNRAMIGNHVTFNGTFTEVSLGDFTQLQ